MRCSNVHCSWCFISTCFLRSPGNPIGEGGSWYLPAESPRMGGSKLRPAIFLQVISGHQRARVSGKQEVSAFSEMFLFNNYLSDMMDATRFSV